MGNSTQSLANLLEAAGARIGATGGVAIILGEGVVADVGNLIPPDPEKKSEVKRNITVALLGGGREPQVLKGKLVGAQSVLLAEGLQAYERVRFLGTYRVWQIEGKSFPTVTFVALEKVTSGKAEAATDERRAA